MFYHSRRTICAYLRKCISHILSFVMHRKYYKGDVIKYIYKLLYLNNVHFFTYSLDHAPEIAIIKSIMNPANNPTKNSHHYNTICTLWIWISMGLVRSRINHVWNKIVGKPRRDKHQLWWDNNNMDKGCRDMELVPELLLFLGIVYSSNCCHY